MDNNAIIFTTDDGEFSHIISAVLSVFFKDKERSILFVICIFRHKEIVHASQSGLFQYI